jgi:hypothetical protein
LQTALAVGLCGLALLLALPILDFGSISARSQIARLNSGKVSPEQFDWGAMAFSFGPAGRSELRKIANGGAPAMRTMAVTALKAANRWDVTPQKIVAGPRPMDITVYPQTATVPPDLRDLLLKGSKSEDAFCSEGGACRVYPQTDGATFIVVMDGCARLPQASFSDPKADCSKTPGVFVRQNGKWANVYNSGVIELSGGPNAQGSLKEQNDALNGGDVRIVPVEKRQLMIGGKPAGEPF